MSMVHNQRINGGIMKGRAPPLARLASENSASQVKPKLIRLNKNNPFFMLKQKKFNFLSFYVETKKISIFYVETK